jgi:hypothetical protein
VFFTAGSAFGLNFFQQGGGAVFTADQIRVFSTPLGGQLAAEGLRQDDWVRLLTRVRALLTCFSMVSA